MKRHFNPVAPVEVSMSRCLFRALLVGVALGASAMPAFAVTCYEVTDRTDTVIFRDSRTPVDLSEAGMRVRAAMRERGELLVIFDTPACTLVGRGAEAAGRKLTTDEIVAEWRDNWSTNSYRLWSPNFGGSSPNFGNSPANMGGSSAPAQSRAGTPPRSSGY
jgi:hypothetical protein